MRSRAIVTAVFTAVLMSVAGGSVAHADSNKKVTKPAPPPPAMVTVQAGDNLTKLANDNHTTYVRLYDANSQISDPDLIYPGQQIRIPADAEQLPDRPLPTNAVAAATAQAVSAPTSSGSSYTPVSAGSAGVWDRLAACESGGNWAINTGNGFYGGLQFTAGSWAAVGGAGLPSQASREEQIARGQMLQARSGWGAWPACSAKLGL